MGVPSGQATGRPATVMVTTQALADHLTTRLPAGYSCWRDIRKESDQEKVGYVHKASVCIPLGSLLKRQLNLCLKL